MRCDAEMTDRFKRYVHSSWLIIYSDPFVPLIDFAFNSCRVFSPTASCCQTKGERRLKTRLPTFFTG